VGQIAGVELGARTLKILAKDASGCLTGVLWWPLAKLVKVVLYFLTIKECLDWLAEGTVRAEMVRSACEVGALPAHPKRVRKAMVRALREENCSPVMRVLLRRPRPQMALPEGGWTVRLVYRLVRMGGGLLAIESFSQKLATLMVGEE